MTDLKASGPAATRLIGHDRLTADISHLTWSPDSLALAFTQPLTAGQRAQLRLYSIADGKTHTLTTDRYDTDAITFTPGWPLAVLRIATQLCGHRQSQSLGRSQYGAVF